MAKLSRDMKIILKGFEATVKACKDAGFITEDDANTLVQAFREAAEVDATKLLGIVLTCFLLIIASNTN